MKRLQYSLATLLLGILGCTQQPSIIEHSSKTNHAAYTHRSSALQQLTTDVERWTRDGIIDTPEIIEFLGRAGYDFRLSRSMTVYLVDGQQSLALCGEEDHFPLSSLDLERFLASYSTDH